MWRRRLIILMLTVLAHAGLARAAEAAEKLEGRYTGIQDMAGAELVVEPNGEGFTGTFTGPRGDSQQFAAEKVGDGAAQGAIDLGGRSVMMRITPLPFGAEVVLVPFENGTPRTDGARIVHFVRAGLDTPKPPADFVPPPADAKGRFAAYSFLASYEFWSPEGVRNGYLSLAPKHRTMIRLFPAVQLDVIWKLCLAPQAEGALGIALRGQGVSCDQVVKGIAKAQETGRFDDYKAEVKRQGDALRTAVRCGDGYVASKETCDRAAREVSRAATSLETAASVLKRYR